MDVSTDLLKNSLRREPIAFGDVLKLCQDLALSLTDIAIPMRELNLTDNLEVEYEGKTLYLTDWSLSQLCSKLDVPTKYIKKCTKYGYYPLAKVNLGVWIQQATSEIILRCYGNDICGVLSDRYATLESLTALIYLNNCINIDSFEVTGYFVSTEKAHLRLSTKRALPIEGEDLHASIIFDNSMVGKSSLKVYFVIENRGNGSAIHLPESKGCLYLQRHTGIDEAFFLKTLYGRIRDIPDLITEMKDVIIKAKEMNLTSKKVNKLLDEIVSKGHLGIHSKEMLQDAVNSIQNPTVWDVVGALGDIATQFNLERQSELEELSGTILAFD